VAFSDPQSTQNPAVGTKATAALLNVWDADQDFLHDPSTAPGASAHRTTNQTITGTQTINWTAETFDVGTMHDNVTNNERLTIPTAGDGLYLVCLQVRGTGGTTITPRIVKNGTTVLAKKTRTNGNNSDVACSCAWFGKLVATDYLIGTVTGGTTLDAGNLRVSLSATWLGLGVGSESFLYTSLADIMATPYNGQVMPAAFGDQVRENLMALYTGETFKVSSTVAQTSGILYTYNTLNWATPNVRTAAGTGFAGYTAGSVQVPPGVWIVGFCADQSNTPVSLRIADAQGRTPGATQTFARDNTANVFSVYAFAAGLNTVSVLPDATPSTSVSEIQTELWGYQLSDL